MCVCVCVVISAHHPDPLTAALAAFVQWVDINIRYAPCESAQAILQARGSVVDLREAVNEQLVPEQIRFVFSCTMVAHRRC